MRKSNSIDNFKQFYRNLHTSGSKNLRKNNINFDNSLKRVMSPQIKRTRYDRIIETEAK
jgi:hypothetical protein